MFDEETIVKSLVFGDIEHFKSVISDCISAYYKTYDPVKCVSKTKLLDIVCNIHELLDDLMDDTEEILTN